jgi:hypothetical protein
MLRIQELERLLTDKSASSRRSVDAESGEIPLAPTITGKKTKPVETAANSSFAMLAAVLMTLLMAFTCQARASAVFSYTLTTVTDPVKPGQIVQFKLTASNLTSAVQYLAVVYHVPQFTTAVGTGYAAGTALT